MNNKCINCLGEANPYWSVACYQCSDKNCPECSKIRLGVVKGLADDNSNLTCVNCQKQGLGDTVNGFCEECLFEYKTDYCVCGFRAAGTKKNCSICGTILPGFRLYCGNCFASLYGEKSS